VSSTVNPAAANRVSHDGTTPGAAAADRRTGDGSAMFAWCLTAPVVLYYLAIFILHWVPADVTDSAGTTHKVRMRLTANFIAPWWTLWACDLFMFCPAHYWLTLYSVTRAVDWKRHGNARGTVEAVAAAVQGLTRAEAVHFSVTFFPINLSMTIAFFRLKYYWPATVFLLINIFMFTGQRLFELLGRPRAAIVRFRGPATEEFAWSAMKQSLGAAVLMLLWCLRFLSYWLGEPYILPVAHAPLAPDPLMPTLPKLLDRPYPHVVDAGYHIDEWLGYQCSGTLAGDPAEPWVINVSGCDCEMFLSRCPTSTTNATLPSQWTALRFRRYWGTFLFPPVLMGEALMFYQAMVGEGMFSGLKELQYDRTEMLAAVTLGLVLTTGFIPGMMAFSDSSDVHLDWYIMLSSFAAMAPLCLVGCVLVWKDSLAELARSRANRQARWKLLGQYAAFMSHYKTEAAADARHIKDKLVDKLSAPVFLDSDDLMDLRNLCHQVSMSDVLVLFQTRDLLTRPWCVQRSQVPCNILRAAYLVVANVRVLTLC
jgi:hypothetical protein